jgi:hypothetical protein
VELSHKPSPTPPRASLRDPDDTLPVVIHISHHFQEPPSFVTPPFTVNDFLPSLEDLTKFTNTGDRDASSTVAANQDAQALKILSFFPPNEAAKPSSKRRWFLLPQ